ncbi:FAD-dependent oxidoreductase [Halosolutus gelatinilyticus]|uniref:FAD-dependent oxidoreductase n=1 Tax=Halosolutus gelatinilyticus TaxID=2931975 RepID=UPI001FF4455F|nr:FAD-dependent monooxygenase [Halosolutus gelatinilyticus]
MTFRTVPRYDPDRLAAADGRAVVVGGSMAGLLAARVLADAFREVTVLERDPLESDSEIRRGVPQAGHVHVLLEAGRATIERLFPGYGAELSAAGGLELDAATELRHYQRGGFLTDGPSRLPMYSASRPLFERLIRERLADRDGVTIRPGRRVVDYRTDDRTAVDGVVVRDRSGGESELAADLVVDATGRASRTPDWLERHGYPSPTTDAVTVDLVYGTAVVERPSDVSRGYLVAPSPAVPRGGTAVPVEGDRWIVTLFGLHGERPPPTARGFREFARGLPTPELGELLEAHRWDGDDLRHYPFPASRWRRYEALPRFPDGLVVTGDAIASFNPIYGQGMSIAALEAMQLHHALAAGDRRTLAARFFDRAAAVVEPAWRLSVCADFQFPRTTGPKPRGTALVNRYVSRLLRTAQTDGRVSERFSRVLRLERPPRTLFAPEIVWRVLRPS